MKIISSSNLTTKPNQVTAPRSSQGNLGAYFVAQNPTSQAQKTLSPSYFHPSFGMNSRAQIKALSEFLDYAIANPKDTNFVKEKFKLLFFNTVDTIIETTHSIGRGKESAVYKLDDTYVLKVEHGKNANFCHLFTAVDNSACKNLKTWYGMTLADIFDIKVLKNANPRGESIPAGIPYKKNITEELIQKYNGIYLPKCANLPQKAFDDVAEDFNTLNTGKIFSPGNYPYVFDCVNPNNFLIDADSIKIMDDLAVNYYGDKNNLAGMLQPLVNSYQPVEWAKFDTKLIEPRREILKKCLLGCEKTTLEMPKRDITMVEKGFKLAGLENKWAQVEDKIIKMRTNIPNHEERTWELEKYFDKL